MLINTSLCNSQPHQFKRNNASTTNNHQNFQNEFAQNAFAMSHFQLLPAPPQRNVAAANFVVDDRDINMSASVSTHNPNNDILNAIKAKEQKFCQDIFEKFLREMNGNNVATMAVVAKNEQQIVTPPHRITTVFRKQEAEGEREGEILQQLSKMLADNKNNNNIAEKVFADNRAIMHCDGSQQQHHHQQQQRQQMYDIAAYRNLPSSLALSSSMTPSPSSSSSSSSTSCASDLLMVADESLSSSSSMMSFENTTALPLSPSSNSSCSNDEIEDHRPYRCTICDKRFRFKSNLFEHKSLHVKAHAFHCPFCGKTCRLKGNLKKHLQVHVNTVEDLEKLWKKRFSRSSGRPRKDTPQKPLPAVGDDLGLVPINKTKPFMATWVFSNASTLGDAKPRNVLRATGESVVRSAAFRIENLL